MIELIQKIQSLRKFSLNPAGSFDRSEIIKNLIGELTTFLDSGLHHQMAGEQKLSEGLIEDWEIKGSIQIAKNHLEAYQNRIQSEVFPTGLLALMTQQAFPLRMTLERWIPAFLAGNVCLIQWPSNQPLGRLNLESLLLKAGTPAESFQIVEQNLTDLAPFLFEHPSIMGVSIVSGLNLPEVLPLPRWERRKFQMWLGGFTTNLILDEAGLNQAVSQLKLDLKSGLYRTPYFPQRWLTLDSLEKQTESKLNAVLPAPEEGTQAFLNQAQSEEGKISHGWIKHLPLCSVIHQSEVRLPTVTLNSVKYPFDMQKWVNHSAIGFAVQIWGDETKVSKLIEKLEVGKVLINCGHRFYDTALLGAKGCIYGTPDLRFDGLFFSEPRHVKSSTLF